MYNPIGSKSYEDFENSEEYINYKDRVVDEANLLTDWEEDELENKLEQISEKNRADVVIVTVNSTGH
jgi:uncharacterized membrane protein YgcG